MGDRPGGGDGKQAEAPPGKGDDFISYSKILNAGAQRGDPSRALQSEPGAKTGRTREQAEREEHFDEIEPGDANLDFDLPRFQFLARDRSKLQRIQDARG